MRRVLSGLAVSHVVGHVAIGEMLLAILAWRRWPCGRTWSLRRRCAPSRARVHKRQVICGPRKALGQIDRYSDILEAADDVAQAGRVERERLEAELRLSQRLEAVGHLVAGVAHEINTPMRFVGDSLRFASSAFDDLRELGKGVQGDLHRPRRGPR